MKIKNKLLLGACIIGLSTEASAMMTSKQYKAFKEDEDRKSSLSTLGTKKNKRSEDLSTIEKLLTNHLKNNKNLVNFSKDKDILLLIGSTGAGKTSLISYLTGLDLIYNSDDSDHGISLKEEIPGFEIDRGGQSVTHLPSYRSIPGKPYLLYDMPGLEDTRGTEYEILNASFIKNIVENAKNVGFIFVEDKGTLWSKRGKNLKNLVDKAKTVFKVDESNSLLVVTKVKSAWDEKKLIQSIKKDFSEELKSDSLLSQWVESEQIFCRHKDIDEKDKDLLLAKLKDLKLKKNSSIDVSSLYSDQIRLKSITKELKKNLFSVFEIDDKTIVDFRSSKEVEIFIKKKANLLGEYRDSVRQDNLLSLLAPLSAIDLNDWENEAQSEFDRLMAKLKTQQNILLDRETAQEEAERERKAKIKAQEESKSSVSYNYYPLSSYPHFSTGYSASTGYSTPSYSQSTSSSLQNSSNIRQETYGSRTVYRDMNTGKFTKNPNK